ncbi:efflux transporter outer membrane subunit [Sphingobium sp. HBC34]|uniref:Efflux transporter outer membrane subunit n=1 Tax=Sphingobium cyanobacteriorum TaxID=3063954 RepID=A0ABT8ZK23_9SPHN|nr:efflux transporter outer membrane subunit [Sphingobium sp. HBC34]MDO7834562.1 efflux transporter outer membrane subunit [Sphingobium sp. HBC34]
MSVSRMALAARMGGVASSLLLLGACAAVPDLGPQPQLRAPESVEASRSLMAAPAVWPGEGWWKVYGDPQLDALIAEGLRASPDVAMASARVRSATAMAAQAGAALVPTIDGEASTAITRQSYNMGAPSSFVPQGWLGTGRLALDLGFDLDLWGKNRASLAAATSDARAAAIDAQQARLALSTAIADAYADLVRLHDDAEIAQRTLDIRMASQMLVAERRRNGLETRGSVRQADATVSSARAQLAGAQMAIALRRHQIAALIGAGPDRGLSIVRPRVGALAPLGLPADVTTNLVARRPDVAAALARAQAAASRIKVARADFYPAVRLSALIGVQSLGYETLFANNVISAGRRAFTDTLFSKDSLFGNAGPAISLPIFHGGALQAQYRGARASYDEAVAAYDKTVLTAYQQVADAVTMRKTLDQRLIDARAAVAASQDAYDIAQKRYKGGLSTYLDVLNVEDQLLAARQALAGLEASAFSTDIALVRALGGGFSDGETLSKDQPHG